MNPQISIIVPVYNVEKYLDRCLESLVNQTFQNIEIILVDDNSQDNSLTICYEWSQKDNRIKVVHKHTNEGLGLARNTGINFAKGDYVAFVDSDDYIDLNMYEKLISYAYKKTADIVCCGIKYITNNNCLRDLTNVKSLLEINSDDIGSYILDMIASEPFVRAQRKYEMSSCTAIYRKKIIDDYNIWFDSEREVLSEDLLFNIKYLKHSSLLISLPEALYYYCQNDSSTSSVFKKDKFERAKHLYILLLDLIGNSNESILRLDRMLIGYARGYVLILAQSKCPGKLALIRELLRDKTFSELKQRYPPKYLPSYHKELYWMQVNRHSILVLLLSSLIVFTKKVKDRIAIINRYNFKFFPYPLAFLMAFVVLSFGLFRGA